MRNIYRIPCLLFSIILLVSSTSYAQDPITFSQYFLNPFQFNPSFAAQHGHAEANLMLRQQWVGIENAPKAATFNIQAPFGKAVSLGFTANASETILVKSASVLGTFAYRVNLGYYHHLNFGLSLGVAMNNFDLNAIADAGIDPTLTNLVQRTSNAVNQFGINYQYKNLNIGFALPQLLDNRSVGVKEFQDIKFNPFENKFASVAYSVYVSRDIQLSPIVIYRSLDNVQYQLEGMITATFRNTIWIGASYREGYGVTGFIGFRAKKVVRAGYAYERPIGNSLSSATSATHEFYAGMKLGRRDREAEYFAEKKRQDSLEQVAALEQAVPPVVEEKKEEPKEEPVVVKEEPVVTTPVDTTTVKETPPPVVEQPKVEPPKTEKVAEAPPTDQIHKGFYVIVGAFKNYNNAMREINELREMSLFPEMIYMLDKDFYYVYLYHSEDRKAAIKELEKARNRIPKAWLLEPHPHDDKKGGDKKE